MIKDKVLIVDDDEDLHTLYSLFLNGESFHIRHAFDGLQGLKAVEEEKPDLIILDMIMPNLDGEGFFTALRTEKHLDIPVIIASVNDKIPTRMTDLGNVHKILKKPVPMDQFIAEIKKALQK